ncbi:MAG: NUDIX domain-containing protein [Nanoarchaeota archaeon]|nr:NUDIX domain-containing protein [Nanoarchaeota archaeon]MBU1031231.1 NUDIX domain-containing protein [Nanoarchaeota archaeon]MBU1849532.1 NUDIX domain-containing protein [Nanoarchaeota archaeon]
MKKEQAKVKVGIIVFKDNFILLGKKPESTSKHSSGLDNLGEWVVPQGFISFGESFEQAAYKKLKEKTTLQAKNLKVMQISNHLSEKGHSITVGVLCTDFHGKPRTTNMQKVVSWLWFPVDNLPMQIGSLSKKLLKNFFEESFYKH